MQNPKVQNSLPVLRLPYGNTTTPFPSNSESGGQSTLSKEKRRPTFSSLPQDHCICHSLCLEHHSPCFSISLTYPDSYLSLWSQLISSLLREAFFAFLIFLFLPKCSGCCGCSAQVPFTGGTLVPQLLRVFVLKWSCLAWEVTPSHRGQSVVSD